MALSVKLYRVVGKGKDRRYVPIDLGGRGRRSKEEVTGPFYFLINDPFAIGIATLLDHHAAAHSFKRSLPAQHIKRIWVCSCALAENHHLG